MDINVILITIIVNCVLSFIIAGFIGHKVSMQLMNYYYEDKKENERRFLIIEKSITDK